MWVAPSLNYTMVESTVLNYADNALMEVHLEDIQVGREADPELFRIPEGFERVYVGPLSITPFFRWGGRSHGQEQAGP
jgi:hypothetical protein